LSGPVDVPGVTTGLDLSIWDNEVAFHSADPSI
jgi:hypothetical protein